MNYYILAILLLFVGSHNSQIPQSHSQQKTVNDGTENIVFKSTDGGQMWKDISKGLPENLRQNGIDGDNLFANDKGLFLQVEGGLYHNSPGTAAPFWTKENFTGKRCNIAPATSAIPANNYWGVNFKKANGTTVWSPIFENFHEQRIRSVFETANGTVFIGIDRGIFRSTDNGKTWKHVHAGLYAGHMAESDGVLLAASMRKIIRSTDNGESWTVVNNEGDVVFDVKKVDGGFAAMTAVSMSNTRGLSISYDGGKTWQKAGDGSHDKDVVESIRRNWNDRPTVQAFQTSITQFGENFYSNHPDGIFRSVDNGKTWTLLFPSAEDKVFGLLFSGNTIYAVRSIRNKKGC